MWYIDIRANKFDSFNWLTVAWGWPYRAETCRKSKIKCTFNDILRNLKSRAVAYCRQPASTVTLGIEPRWDPWPYICSVSRVFFFFFFRCSSFDKKGGVGLFNNWCSLTTPYSTRGHIKVGDIYILYIFTKQTDSNKGRSDPTCRNLPWFFFSLQEYTQQNTLSKF
jgi:hypothetical protein